MCGTQIECIGGSSLRTDSIYGLTHSRAVAILLTLLGLSVSSAMYRKLDQIANVPAVCSVVEGDKVDCQPQARTFSPTPS